MSWVKSKKLWIVVLAVLIAAVNIVTAVVFLHYTLKPGKYEIFKTPDSIVLHYQKKSLELYPDDSRFNEIVTLNRKRADAVDIYKEGGFGNAYYAYDNPEDNINDINNLKDFYIEYRYDDDEKFSVYTQTGGKKSIESDRVYYILTGSFCNEVFIPKVKQDCDSITVGGLISNAELIKLVFSMMNY